MNNCYAYLLLAALAGSLPAGATQEAMNAAFNRWEQEMTEYQAAISSAESDDARAAIAEPDGKEVGKALWKAISGKTGTRKKLIKGTRGPSLNTVKDQVRTVNTYEFEEKWAAPAVVWFLKHPKVLAEIFAGKESRFTAIAEALLDSVHDDHYDSPLMAEICPVLASTTSVRSYETLKKIYSQNKDRNARGCAALAMSILLSNPLISSTEGSEAMAMSRRLYYLRQALTLTEDNMTFGNVSVSEAASNQAYIIRHLSEGQTPPQVTMADLDGQKASFPVKDTPAILFFWHPSDPVGTGIVAKHLSLKKQFPALHFLPITAHPLDEQMFREDLQALEIPHTYIDDEENSVSHAYRISLLPLAVFVDAQGDIRYIGYPDIKLQTALDSYFRSHPAQAPAAASSHPEATQDREPQNSEALLQPGSTLRSATNPPSEQPAASSTPSASQPSSAPAQPPSTAKTQADTPAITPDQQPGTTPPPPPANGTNSQQPDSPSSPPPLRPMPEF